MRHKWILFSIFFLALFFSSCFLARRNEQPIQTAQTQIKSFFIPVPIVFSPNRSPYLDVTIENNTFSLAFDLGFRGDLSIPSSLIHQISSKTFLQNKPMYGFRGKEHQTKMYRIPKAKIGRIFFEHITLQERSEEACDESVVLQNPSEEVSERNGLIGWHLFQKTNLLIDTSNGKIAICDSLETLHENGYSIDDFMKTSLFVDRGLIEFEANTDYGPLRCVLDTGSTWNILNTDMEEGKPMEEVIWEPSNVLEYPSFVVGSREFGPIEFHRMPIKIPIRVEAILGMEFFDNYLVFIDFSEKQVYLTKQKH